VGRLEGIGDLPGDGQGLGDRDRTATEPVGERFPFHQFQHERVHAVGALDPVNRGDVWVIQRRQHARFAFEARHAVRIVRERTWENLDRDVAPERCVVSAVDFAL
jgi:hypothetical protein